MKMLRMITAVLAVLAGGLFAQELSEIKEFSTPGIGFDLSDAESEAAYLDFSRLRMDHSISMSAGGSSLGSESYLTYHNQFYMPLSSRMSFYGNLYWQLQTYASEPALQRLNNPAGEIYFDANIRYQLGENSSLSLGFSRYPSMIYSPYNSGYYSGLWGVYPYNSLNGGFLR